MTRSIPESALRPRRDFVIACATSFGLALLALSLSLSRPPGVGAAPSATATEPDLSG